MLNVDFNIEGMIIKEKKEEKKSNKIEKSKKTLKILGRNQFIEKSINNQFELYKNAL